MYAPALLATAAGVGGNIPLWLVAPFALLLLLIAVMPLTPHGVKQYWDRYYAHTAVGLGLAVIAFYLAKIGGGGGVVGHTLGEYFSFICLIGSLFVVAGGIHLKVRDEATPLANITFLAIGAVIANIIGTTGASMVLIRPWIRMNKIRVSAYHVVFFIFVVSNVGGALTPIGDPPLFLGYLRGVPFFWLIQSVVVQWLFTLALILAAFYVFDRRSYLRTPAKIRAEIDQPSEGIRFDGKINLLFLAVIIGSVFLPDRFFVRELVMLAAAAASYKLTPPTVHAENQFSFGPIKEVAFLFAGIFATMMPALGYIDQHGEEFGVKKPVQYYLASGSLSSVLDNAPTYATFLRLAEATAQSEHPAEFASAKGDEIAIVQKMLVKPDYAKLVIAVSLGSVFFGAMTYIGNGPNFMVKSIADSSGVKTPSFFGYVFKYSLPILFPILALGGWLFL
ncbi:MAG: sodium:proton antiporter [Verrucomicrobia bacterium]|nr:sodium:proton antiporter [Verrucomicrobiota bacterium]